MIDFFLQDTHEFASAHSHLLMISCLSLKYHKFNELAWHWTMQNAQEQATSMGFSRAETAAVERPPASTSRNTFHWSQINKILLGKLASLYQPLEAQKHQEVPSFWSRSIRRNKGTRANHINSKPFQIKVNAHKYQHSSYFDSQHCCEFPVRSALRFFFLMLHWRSCLWAAKQCAGELAMTCSLTLSSCPGKSILQDIYVSGSKLGPLSPRLQVGTGNMRTHLLAK